MQKLNKQQVNNKLRTNDFNQEVSMAHTHTKETADILGWVIKIF